MSQVEVDKVIPQSGTTLTIGDSGDTITVPAGATFDASSGTLTLPDGSVSLAKLSATGTKDATTFLRGDNTFATPAGGENVPAFLARMSSDQSVTDAVNTKVQFDNEIFDTDDCYDPTTNYRFTPTVAGYYFVYATARAESGGAFMNDVIFRIEINDADYARSVIVPADNVLNIQPMHVYAVAEFNGTTDYVEIFINVDITAGGTPNLGGGVDSTFGAFKLIGT